MTELDKQIPTDNTQRLAGDKILPLLVKFSLPATIGTVLNGTYNIVDRIFIGRAIGEEGLAAATIVFPLMMIIISFGLLFGHGSCALISISLGQGRKDNAERLLGQAFALFGIFAVVFIVLALVFIEPLLTIFGASENILAIAADYARIIVIGVFFQHIAFGINSLIRGEGNIKVSMVTMAIGACLNIALDAFFLFGLKMGIKGAALATVIAQTAAAAWVLYYYLSGRSYLSLFLHNIRISKDLTKQVIATGCPPFIIGMVGSVTQAIIYNSLRSYGSDTEIAIMGVIFTLLMLIFMPMIGLNHGTQPIIGFNYGAKNYQRVRQTAVLNIIIATSICVAIYIVINFVPQWLFKPFSSSDDFIKRGGEALGKFMFLMPLIGTIFVTTNYFQAIAKPKVAIAISMVRQVAILVPAVLIFPLFWGVDGIWFSGPASDGGAFLVAAFVMRKEMGRLKSLSAKPQVQADAEVR